MRTAPRGTVLLALALACGAAGCGGGSDYANKPRPPTPINVTTAITTERISVSPKMFGGGPAVFTISNQTPEPQTVLLETQELGGKSAGIKKSSGLIGPHATADMKADLREGTYSIRLRRGGVPAATVEVGKERPSAQNELLEP